jgi:two-component system OmpR family response regulator
VKLLVVEDDGALRDVLVRAFREAGHIVDAAADGNAGEALALDGAYDAIVLDILLPHKDGIAIVRTMRDAGVATPVLFLTARTTEADTIAALDAGGDDYVRKPFGIGEVLARLRSISRREKVARPPILEVGGVRYDPTSRRATRYERDLALTRRETVFLEYFMRNSGCVLPREAIAIALWPHDRDIGSNIIDVYVKRLRGKLHGAGEPPVLHTVRGIGYRFEDN